MQSTPFVYSWMNFSKFTKSCDHDQIRLQPFPSGRQDPVPTAEEPPAGPDGSQSASEQRPFSLRSLYGVSLSA